MSLVAPIQLNIAPASSTKVPGVASTDAAGATATGEFSDLLELFQDLSGPTISDENATNEDPDAGRADDRAPSRAGTENEVGPIPNGTAPHLAASTAPVLTGTVAADVGTTDVSVPRAGAADAPGGANVTAQVTDAPRSDDALPAPREAVDITRIVQHNGRAVSLAHTRAAQSDPTVPPHAAGPSRVADSPIGGPQQSASTGSPAGATPRAGAPLTPVSAGAHGYAPIRTALDAVPTAKRETSHTLFAEPMSGTGGGATAEDTSAMTAAQRPASFSPSQEAEVAAPRPLTPMSPTPAPTPEAKMPAVTVESTHESHVSESGDSAAGAAAPTAPGQSAPDVLTNVAPQTVSAPVDPLTQASAVRVAPPQPHLPLPQQISAPVHSFVVDPDGDHTLVIKLAPEHLGPMTVKATIENGQTRVELIAPNDTSKEAIRSHIGEIRRDLAVSGLSAVVNVTTEPAATGAPSQHGALQANNTPGGTPTGADHRSGGEQGRGSFDQNDSQQRRQQTPEHEMPYLTETPSGYALDLEV